MEMLQDVLGSLGFNINIALANFFNFLIIFFLLQKFLFKKIGTTLEERKKVIEEGVRKSEQSEKVLHTAEVNAKTLLRNAKEEANTVVKEASVKAESLAESIKSEALLSAGEIMKEANRLKDESFEAGLVKLFGEKERLIAALFEKTLRESMTEEKNNQFITSLKK